jgi:hypothetical protein
MAAMRNCGHHRMKTRRLIILNGADMIAVSMDISDLDHASSTFPMTMAIQTQCDLGDWHTGQKTILEPWGRALKTPDYRAWVTERRKEHDT